jgi:hypothetical protein
MKLKKAEALAGISRLLRASEALAGIATHGTGQRESRS